jgi:hypothetical protein
MRLKSHSLCFSILICAAVLTSPPAFAQVNEKEKAEKELEKRNELQRQTLGLLEEIVSGAWSLKLPENRSFVLATAADLFWTHDEKRARSLFWEALNNLNLPNPALGDQAPKEQTKKTSAKPAPAKGPTKEQLQELNRYYEVFAKRRDFLQRVARRDSQLALDMLHATRQIPPAQLPGYLQPSDETSLEEEIATVAAAQDPKRALQIARQSLAKGITLELTNLLFQLNQQDQNAASALAADIIAKLDDENLGTDLKALLVAMHLLEHSRTSAVSESEAQNSTLKSVKLDDDQKRRVVEMIADASLSATGQGSILHNIRFVMPEIEQLAPDRAARIKAKLAEWNRTLSKDQQEWNTYNSLHENATPEEMIKAAGKMDDEQRDSLYRSAVIHATMRGRGDALREFINTQVADESRKKGLLDLLDTEQIYEAVNRGKSEDLQKLLSLIRLKEQRALAMAELAILLGKKGEHDAAVKLLDDARLLVKVDLDSEKQSNALLAIMLGYALVEPGKAFTMIEPIIDHANDDISKLLLLDKIVKTGVVKNGEIALYQSGIPIDFAMFKYSPGVIALAKADFERTKSLADRFERNELRTLARVVLVRSILRSLEPATEKTQPAVIQ